MAPGQPRYRLLIVDDAPTNRQLLRKLFTDIGSSEQGFELREAENGQQTLDQIHSHQPALAAQFGQLADAFDYMQIVALLQKISHD
jgi:CheY-like chemotaxis protein